VLDQGCPTFSNRLFNRQTANKTRRTWWLFRLVGMSIADSFFHFRLRGSALIVKMYYYIPIRWWC